MAQEEKTFTRTRMYKMWGHFQIFGKAHERVNVWPWRKASCKTSLQPVFKEVYFDVQSEVPRKKHTQENKELYMSVL